MMNTWKGNAIALGLLWLRVLMGLGIGWHGYGKIFGGRMAKFTEGVAGLGFPVPEFFAWAVALSELVGGMFVVVGLGTRFAALFIFITMSVAVFLRHATDPFSVKELALAYWVMAGTLILIGSGPFSVDARLRKR